MLQLGTPTIVINCAAARINGHSLLDLPAEAFEKTIRTNLVAAFHLYQVFVPGIIAEAENGGTYVPSRKQLSRETHDLWEEVKRRWLESHIWWNFAA